MPQNLISKYKKYTFLVEYNFVLNYNIIYIILKNS